MFSQIEKAYNSAADSINAQIIPSGKMLQELIKMGYGVHRDTFHLSLGLGRFSVALLWLKLLTGIDIKTVDFHDFDAEVTEKEYNDAVFAADLFDRLS